MQEIYSELEENRPKVETVLAQGQEYLKKSPPGAAGNLQTNLRTLKQRWDNVTARANDKKIKLEIALKEATEFHDALQVILYTCYIVSMDTYQLNHPTSPNFKINKFHIANLLHVLRSIDSYDLLQYALIVYCLQKYDKATTKVN